MQNRTSNPLNPNSGHRWIRKKVRELIEQKCVHTQMSDC